MIERGQHFGFALKARETLGIRRERGRKNLDGDLAFELRVRRPIDLTHPAFANQRGDFVDTKAGAGRQGHDALHPTGQALCSPGNLDPGATSQVGPPTRPSAASLFGNRLELGDRFEIFDAPRCAFDVNQTLECEAATRNAENRQVSVSGKSDS